MSKKEKVLKPTPEKKTKSLHLYPSGKGTSAFRKFQAIALYEGWNKD